MLQMDSLRFWCVSLCTLGCSDPALPTGACESGVALTVSATAQPEFRWVPECGVGALYVTTEAGNPMWQINSKPQPDFTPTNDIQSRVVYGTMPTKTQALIEAVPLEPGQTYRVILFVTDGQGEQTRGGNTTFLAPAE